MQGSEEVFVPLFIAALFTISKSSIHEWMERQNVFYTSSGIFSLKEGNSDISYNMDESWGHYDKRNKPVSNRQMLCESTCVNYLIKIIETESRMVLAMGCEWERMRSYCLMGI